MKHSLSDNTICRPRTRNCLALALFIAVPLGLGGCGGGGGGGGGGTTKSTAPVSTPDNNDAANTPASTLLDENPLTGRTSFDNFTVTGMQLTVAHILASEQVTFAGDDTFLKLARNDGEVLFLGEVNRDQSLDLLVDLPLGTRVVRYEIFSGSPLDNTLFGEITL